MANCTEHEMEYSALLDGESDPATAAALIDHVAGCSSCQAFVRELRSFQTALGGVVVPPLPEPAPAPVPVVAEESPRRRFLFDMMPRLSWGFAGAFMMLIFLWGTNSLVTLDPADAMGGNLSIRLGAGDGRMDERRFVALMTEVLEADRKYRDQMFLVLNDINQQQGSDESSVLGEQPFALQAQFEDEGGSADVSSNRAD